MPQISIIIPVYNTENYIRQCLDSVLSQTFTDFECILIDDGSPDNCPVICDEYAAKDSRIVVIHQKNAGVSAARNAGLNIAQGDWIGFIDSDDWVDKEHLEFLHGNALKHNVDVSVSGIFIFHDELVLHGNKEKHETLLTSKEAILFMFDRKSSFGGFSVNKLFRKQLIDSNSLRYDKNIMYMEDLLFFYYVFKFTDKIYYSSQPHYYYRQTTSSVTNQKYFTPAVCTAIGVLDRLYETEQDYEIQQKILVSKIYFIYGICVDCVLNNKKDLTFCAYIYDLKKNVQDEHSLPFIFRCKTFVLVYLSFFIKPYLCLKRLYTIKMTPLNKSK